MPRESHSKREKSSRRHDDYDSDDRKDSRRRRSDRDDGREGKSRKRDRKESKHRDDEKHRSRDKNDYSDEEIQKRDRKHGERRSDGEKRSRRRDKYDYSDEDDSREERRSKHRHRDRDRRDHKRRKRSRDSDDESSEYDRKRSDRKKKKKKHSRKHKDDEKQEKKKIVKPDKSKLVSMGDVRGKPPDTKLDAQEDYFSYHHEFWIYLFREEGTYFNDLETVEARAAFGRFAKMYNAGKLEEPYYSRNFPNDVIEESKTTKHAWGFQTTTAEQKGLEQLQKGIRRQTEYSTKQQDTAIRDVRKPVASHEVSCAPVESLRKKVWTAEERTQQKRDNKKWKDRVKLTHEELTGGPKDLREKKLEQKREQSAKMHGAHRDREAAMELSDAALYGGDSLQATKARIQQNQQRKNQRQASRLQELQQKEEDRKNNMLKMLGLENLQGKKLEIAPRK